MRNCFKFVTYEDREKVAKALKPIYTAVNEVAAALAALRRDFGTRYPGIITVRERAWPEFVPFLRFDASIRKVNYTTNTIESLDAQLRKLIKNRSHFPSDAAAIKLLYLGLRHISGRHIDGEGLARARSERGTCTGTYGWKSALNALAITFPGRLPL